MKLDLHEGYLRSVVFGFQDALVSTTGVIAGVAAGTADKEIVVLAGIVTILVEAMSMGIGQYLSEKAVHQMDKKKKRAENLYVVGGLMFGSYFLGGLVPLTPILLLDLSLAPFISVGAALTGLFVLGLIKAKIVKVNPFSSAVEIFVLGGLATLAGIVAGRLLKV